MRLPGLQAQATVKVSGYHDSWKSDGPKVRYTHNDAKSPESDTDGRQLNCLSKHPIFEMVVRYL